VVVLAAAVLAVTELSFGADEAAACDRWASARGSDRNPGSAQRPYRTVQKLVNRLRAGRTGCLAPGSTFMEGVVIRRPRVTLRTGAAGRRAVIRGGIRFDPGARGATVSSLVVQGQDERRPAVVIVHTNGARILRSDISGLRTLNQSEPCVLIEGVRGTVVDGNAIHNCTRVTTRQLYSAGVVAAGTTGVRITNNVIYHTVGDAIALRGAQATLIRRNVIDGNVSGIYFADNAGNNQVVDNIVSYSGQHHVHSSVVPPVGVTNRVRGNCFFRAYGGTFVGVGTGFFTSSNRLTSPRYVNRPHTFRMRPGPCFHKQPYAYGGGPVRYPVVPKFLVRYRLLGFQRSVKVVSVTLARVAQRAKISVRCVRGCSVSRLPSLAGRWLRRGAVLEVRAQRPGWVGHYARIRVTGLPRGVRIAHGCLDPSGRVRLDCARYR
jgi:parallel beta-helix repeat protein